MGKFGQNKINYQHRPKLMGISEYWKY